MKRGRAARGAVPPRGPWAHYATAVNRAHRAVHEAHAAYRKNPTDPALKAAWEDATAAFHQILTTYPAGFWRALDAVNAGETAGLVEVLAFLEADPWCFRSGYAKSAALKAVTRVALDDHAVQRLQAVVLAAVDGRDRREFRWYCRLARRVLTPEFEAALHARLDDPDPDIQRRARWVLDAIAKHGPLTPDSP